MPIITTIINTIATIMTSIIINITIIIRFIFITSFIISIFIINITNIPTFTINSTTISIIVITITITSTIILFITMFIFYVFLSAIVILFIANIDLMKYNSLILNNISFCSFIEYFLIFVDVFLTMSFTLIIVGRIVFPGISVTNCFLLIMLLPKKSYAYKKKLTKQKKKYKNGRKANPTFYIIRHSLLIVFRFLLSKKIKQPKGKSMPDKNINLIFFNKFLGDTRYNTN